MGVSERRRRWEVGGSRSRSAVAQEPARARLEAVRWIGAFGVRTDRSRARYPAVMGSSRSQEFATHRRNNRAANADHRRTVDHPHAQHDERRTANLVALLDPDGEIGLEQKSMRQQIRTKKGGAV